MKTNLKLLLIAVFYTGLTVNAQQKAALNSAGNTTIFVGADPFIDAYNAALSGDTIYLSGGSYNAPGTIDKGLTVFGAGFHPDSTTATFPTQINTNLYLGENADSLHLEGLQLQTINKNATNQVNNLTLKRCKIESLDFKYSATGFSQSVNLGLTENIITGTLDLETMNNSIVSNNIIQGLLNHSSNNTLQNNVFMYQGYLTYCENNIFSNNIFLNTTGTILSSSDGNFFTKNILKTATPDFDNNAVDIDNYKGVDITSVFVNQAGFAFDYAHDYHLQTAAATTYLGTDGSEVGIYGGLFPYKEGAVPVNPHIQFKNIASQTDNNGDLSIQINVAAQDN